MGEFLKDITLLLVGSVVGYYFSRKSGKKDSSRAECWECYKTILDLNTKLLTDSNSYYCDIDTAANKKALGVSLQGQVKAIGSHSKILCQRLSSPDYSRLQINLRKSVTNNMPIGSPVSTDDVILTHILNAIDHMNSTLMQEFTKKFG